MSPLFTRKMQALRKFLRARQTSDFETCTMVSMRKGKYKINQDDAKTFLELYCSSLGDITPSNCMSLVWRPPPTFWQPMVFDFDFKLEKPEAVSDVLLTQIAELACKTLLHVTSCSGVALLMTRRPEPYESFDKKANKKIFKYGMHVYILGLLISRELACAVRKELIPPSSCY